MFSQCKAYAHIRLLSSTYAMQQETFISADDLRVNLWNLGINDQSFNIVDIKPANMEDLTEVQMIRIAVQSNFRLPTVSSC